MKNSQSIIVSIHKVEYKGINKKISEWRARYITKKINELPISRKEKIECVDKIIQNIKEQKNSKI